MVVQKADVLSADAAKIKATIRDLSTRADEQLRSKGAHTIRLSGDRFSTVVGAELERIYKAAGWTVRINKGDCQREGRWHNVEIT